LITKSVFVYYLLNIYFKFFNSDELTGLWMVDCDGDDRVFKLWNFDLFDLRLLSKEVTFNPFSHTLFLIVANMSLPKRSAPYWSNPLFQFLTFGHSGAQDW